MAAGNDYRRIAVVGLAWWLTTCLLSTYCSVTFLRVFQSPSALTAARFLGSAVIGLLTNAAAPGKQRVPASRLLPLMRHLALPSALLLCANFFNSVAMGASGIVLPYVLKSAIPFFTVCVTRLFMGHTYTAAVYASLVPTVCGVALASYADMECNALGLGAAVASSLAQTLLNVASKPIIRSSGLAGTQAQTVMAFSCALVMVPSTVLALTLLAPAEGVAPSAPFVATAVQPWGGFVLVLTALAYHIEYSLNFIFVTLVSPLTFSIVDITRRLGIIVSGALMFSKQLSALNQLGIAIAVIGVGMYTVADNMVKRRLGETARAGDERSVHELTAVEVVGSSMSGVVTPAALGWRAPSASHYRGGTSASTGGHESGPTSPRGPALAGDASHGRSTRGATALDPLVTQANVFAASTATAAGGKLNAV